jgi:hypothetical protein
MPEFSAPIDLCTLEGVCLVGPLMVRAVAGGNDREARAGLSWLRCVGGRILAMHRAAF